MDSNTDLVLNRADNELFLARAVYLLSENSKVKKEIFSLPEEITFYSAVISHAYYSIFYSAKAYVMSKNSTIPEQGQHNAIYQKFKKFVKEGDIEKELLIIYEDLRVNHPTASFCLRANPPTGGLEYPTTTKNRQV